MFYNITTTWNILQLGETVLAKKQAKVCWILKLSKKRREQQKRATILACTLMVYNNHGEICFCSNSYHRALEKTQDKIWGQLKLRVNYKLVF